MASTFQVAGYEYCDWSSRSDERATLFLWGTGGEGCMVSFEADETKALREAFSDAPNDYQFFYYQSQLDHLIDMLRNETPIWVSFNQGQPWNSRISTSENPPGEGRQF